MGEGWSWVAPGGSYGVGVVQATGDGDGRRATKTRHPSAHAGCRHETLRSRKHQRYHGEAPH
ncbi:hypothetical protein QBC98_007095 [Kitasatospora acidiphila]